MNIEVRPTPALRRHRDRIVGALVAITLTLTSLAAVAELAR